MTTTTGVSVEPGWLWRQWWIWTEPTRLVIRLLSERLLRQRITLRLALSGLRVAGHLAIGHLWWTALLVVWLVAGVPFKAVIVVGLLVELVLAGLRVRRGVPVLLAAFRLGIKFHRVWPRTYADTAGKSEKIQDREAGSGGESRAPVVRSVVDHPRLPWRFWVRWPVITFRVGVAPGRSFAQLERVMAQMSANIPWIHALELEYHTDRSSFGLLHVAIDDVLARSKRTAWTTTPTTDTGPDLPRWLQWLRPTPPAGLRLVQDDNNDDGGEKAA